MKILFDDIPEAGLTLEVTDSSWFPEEDWVRVGPVRAELFLIRRNQRVFLDGRLQFASRFECDRCLESYEEVQDFRFRIDFEYLAADDPYWLTEDHQCPEAEMDVVILSEPEIDIEATLEQQVILSVPAKRLCSETCRGLCPSCGHNLNNGSCSCSGLEQDSPFQVLARLKQK
jgi:uncharacterized protein